LYLFRNHRFQLLSVFGAFPFIPTLLAEWGLAAPFFTPFPAFQSTELVPSFLDLILWHFFPYFFEQLMQTLGLSFCSTAEFFSVLSAPVTDRFQF